MNMAIDAKCLGWGSKCAVEAARGGHKDVLEWSLGKDMPLAEARSVDGQALGAAVESGHVEVVEWCVWHGFGGNFTAVNVAACPGRVHLLQRFSNVFPPYVSGKTAVAAAAGGDIATFKWVFDNLYEDIPGKEVVVATAEGGHTELLQW